MFRKAGLDMIFAKLEFDHLEVMRSHVRSNTNNLQGPRISERHARTVSQWEGFTSDTNRVLGSMMSTKCLRRPRKQPCKKTTYLQLTRRVFNHQPSAQWHLLLCTLHFIIQHNIDVKCV